MEGVIPVGSGLTLCVQAENSSFGIVCLDKHMHCVTCKYGSSSCAHVDRIVTTISNCQPEDINSTLEPFYDFISQPAANYPKPGLKEQTSSCVSTSPIPFDLPSSMKGILRKDPSIRFSVREDVAQLAPSPIVVASCPLCHAINSWSDETFLVNNVMLITNTRSITAKGD